ncbi:uncharacterized protein K452DRAFT_287184 [Aplosporella prunicola CBS 121167]|uniref:Uncharacterized protein n=1 Tax=Aplosporella prunicola CBS 121167 TaxID=1176127 RepID=A0A6A6BGI7_9PEZI|nr:uncharacterized protein K452DRAFT_287184 [Aplosporella prunicola CBS 121167]KAF2141987.1 hypothetical protein K452DRAFT_287184 [Aplosporella prunicola CBS 121167]
MLQSSWLVVYRHHRHLFAGFANPLPPITIPIPIPLPLTTTTVPIRPRPQPRLLPPSQRQPHPVRAPRPPSRHALRAQPARRRAQRVARNILCPVTRQHLPGQQRALRDQGLSRRGIAAASITPGSSRPGEPSTKPGPLGSRAAEPGPRERRLEVDREAVHVAQLDQRRRAQLGGRRAGGAVPGSAARDAGRVTGPEEGLLGRGAEVEELV